ncbi:MAG: hypothetical protein ACI8PZ_005253 [Myxococcota bacterium]|jgi:hypothetical protein
MAGLTIDRDARELLAPVEAVIADGLRELADDLPDLEVGIGDVPGTHQLDRHRLTLSTGLLGPGLHHPAEPVQPLPPMDRWRRAAGAVIESAALLVAARTLGRAPGRSWVWRGLAVHLADRAAPRLDLAAPELARAIVAGAPGRFPRSGVAVMRAWEAAGDDPVARSFQVLRGAPISAREWVQIGSWVMDLERGPGALLPVLVQRPVPLDVPCTLMPWSWAPLRVPAHPRGGRVAVDGPGAVATAWAVADTELRTLACATRGKVTLRPESGGPIGRWAVASAQGFGQVLGARGVVFDFRTSGRCDIVLADAFVGPLAAVDLGERMGTSGLVPARWSVDGPNRLRFHDVRTDSLTVHDRSADTFAMPARGFGMGEWLTALGDAPWAWQQSADRLTLRGEMLGGGVEVRLKPDG